MKTPIDWWSRAGREVATVASLDEVDSVRLSPEGDRAAVSVRDPRRGTEDIWVYDLSRNTAIRLTSEPTQESAPVWSPDGRRLVFHSDRNGPPDLYEMPSAGGTVQLFLEQPPGPKQAELFSPDGKIFLFRQVSRKTESDVWMIPLSDSGETGGSPTLLLQTRFAEDQPRFSPDGRWIAHDSDESGGSQIYVTNRDGGGERIRVSTGGGYSPHWRHDGSELFYLAPGHRVMAAAVKTGAEIQRRRAARAFPYRA